MSYFQSVLNTWRKNGPSPLVLTIAGCGCVLLLLALFSSRGGGRVGGIGRLNQNTVDDMAFNPDASSIVDFSKMTVEQVAAYWNRRPCNRNHSQLPVDTKEYFDEVELKKYLAEPHIPKFAQHKSWNGKKVLEIGCGMGTDATNFARNGADYHGVDLSEESVKVAKKRFEVFGLKGNIQQANAEKLASYFPDLTESTKFDLVYSFGVIHHTPHPWDVIAEIKKILKVGGTLKIMMYSKISWKLFWVMKETGIWDLSKLDFLMSKFSEAQVGSPVTYTYTFDELTDLVGPDFKVQELYKDHIFRFDVAKYRKGIYEIDESWKNVSEPMFRAFERELGWHTMLTATYNPK